MLAVDESVHASTHLIHTSQVVCQTAVQLQDIQLPAQFHPQLDDHLERTSATMDDLMEMLAMSSWPEINNMVKLPWDYNGGSSASTMSSNDAGSSLSAPQKTCSTSSIPSSMLGNSMGRQNSITLGHGGQDGTGHLNSNEPGVYYSEELMLAARLSQQHVNQDGFIGSTDISSMSQSQIDGRIQLLPHGMQEAARSALRRISDGTCRAPSLNRSPSIGSSSVCSEISSCQQLSSDNLSPSSINPGWRQSYMGGVLPSQLALGQIKTEPLMTVEGTQNEPHLVGKRFRDDDLSSRAAPQENMFNTFSGAQVQQIRSTGQQIQMQVSAAPFPSHTGIGQSQGAAAVVAGTARPRVRARRGQATDPHSIAERLRRERIADRMKALQELVPHANKTDKASMLDEIIEYVRFLQLQAKVLSVSRIGGAGAVGPLVAEVSTEGHMHFSASALYPSAGASASSQDNIAATEQQVARMMEDDMGAALQFLQKKGLCLMPITLATTISGSGVRPSTGSQSGLPRRTDTLTSTIMANPNAMAGGMLMPAAAHLGDIAAEQGRESAIHPNGAPSGQSSCTLTNGAKVLEETGKTSSL